MIFLTHLPAFVIILFKGWFVYMQAVTPNKKTITELTRYSAGCYKSKNYKNTTAI